jgi:hypothetical protein
MVTPGPSDSASPTLPTSSLAALALDCGGAQLKSAAPLPAAGTSPNTMIMICERQLECAFTRASFLGVPVWSAWQPIGAQQSGRCGARVEQQFHGVT